MTFRDSPIRVRRYSKYRVGQPPLAADQDRDGRALWMSGTNDPAGTWRFWPRPLGSERHAERLRKLIGGSQL